MSRGLGGGSWAEAGDLGLRRRGAFGYETLAAGVIPRRCDVAAGRVGDVAMGGVGDVAMGGVGDEAAGGLGDEAEQLVEVLSGLGGWRPESGRTVGVLRGWGDARGSAILTGAGSTRLGDPAQVATLLILAGCARSFFTRPASGRPLAWFHASSPRSV